MNVRDALESDLESVAELLLLVHKMHVRAQPATYRDVSLESALEFLASRLTEPNAYLRVAEFESEVLGYCAAAVQGRLSTPLLRPGEFIYM